MSLSNNLLKKAAREFGTPSYVYDETQLHKSYMELRNALPDCVDIFYALKVNPNTSLVKLFRSYGANTEVCSLGELEIALKAGVDPKDIIFLGPYKSEAYHRRALEVGVYAIVVESETELRKLSVLAGEMKTVASVAIRINPNFSAAGSPWKMGGRPTHFGIEEDSAVENFERFLGYPNVDIKGIHVYNGTKILEAQSVHDNCQYILNLYKTISEKYNLNFSMVDVGGGLGVKYYDNETELDTEKLKDLLKPLFQEFNESFPNTRIIMESGRFLAGKSASFLVTVDNIKENHGKLFAVADGGANCNSSAIGSGQVLKRNFQISNIDSREGASEVLYNVSGPLCTPDDLLGRDILIDEIEEGDVLAVKATGAYGPSASLVLFHSHGHPAEILYLNGELIKIRKRDTVEDILRPHVDCDLNLQSQKQSEASTSSVVSLGSNVKLSDEIENTVAEVLREVLKIPAEKMISSTSHLRDDLGLDSLTSVEVLIGLEDTISDFSVDPETMRPAHFNTIETLSSYIKESLGVANQPALNKELNYGAA